jgi:16S rRNA C967 or C1407 C5-methylase (RsmB/RsmF family)/NOL1/NOP2/fmu family ribosome biogenesis protein
LYLPKQLLDSLQGVTGFDEANFIEAHSQPAPVSVRLHPVKGTGILNDLPAVSWCPQGRYLPQRPIFTLDPSYHAGAYYVQEASSMFLDHVLRQLLPERDNLRVLDLCAAPGGKSSLILSLLGANSLLISNDVIRTRASILHENMTRWGYMNSWVTSNDPKEFGKLNGYFDVIVVDAPCSGSGLFRKDKDAVNEWSEANVQLCSQRQQRILADIWPSLKEDGILVYATCSYSPQEDEEILDWMQNEFETENLPIENIAGWGITETTAQSGAKGYRFYPDKINGEGFFIAAMRKVSEEKTITTAKFKTQNDKKIKEAAVHLLVPADYAYLQGKEHFFAINATHEADWQLLNKTLYLRKTGITLGIPTAKEWVPEHELALSINKAESIANIELNKEQALKFLKKEDISIPDVAKGWYLVTYNRQALGWIKALGNRVNNYLPKGWRIRMDITDEQQA